LFSGQFQELSGSQLIHVRFGSEQDVGVGGLLLVHCHA
jgi:hypothetical protein